MRSSIDGQHDWARPQGGLTDLFDRIESRKTEKAAQLFFEKVSKRGIILTAIASLVVLVWFRRGHRSSAGHGRAAAGGAGTTHVHLLLDRSGSMSSLAPAVIAGFNTFVKQQQAQPVGGTMLLTLAQFHSGRPTAPVAAGAPRVVFAGRDIHAVQPLAPQDFKPHGQTPLYDAIAKLVALAQRSEASETVFVVVSDGEASASKRTSREQAFKLVEGKRAEGWAFVFLGANQDAYAASHGLAMARGATSNFVPDARGLGAAWADLSAGTSRYRKAVRSGHSAAEKAAYGPAYLDGAAADGFRGAERDYAARGRPPTAAAPAGASSSAATRGAVFGPKGRGRRRALRHRPDAKYASAAKAAAVPPS